MASPEIRQNFVFHSLLVFAVAFKSFFQHGFFVADALGDERDIQQHDAEGNGRGQHQRHHEEEEGSMGALTYGFGC